MVISRLIDTNIVSELVKPQPNSLVLKAFERYEGEIALSAIVWHELIYGWQKMAEGARQHQIGLFLKQVVTQLPVLNYDTNAARVHADIRVEAERQGKPLPFADGQIASIAIANGLTLVTRNLKDFSSIRGLVTENWFG